VSRLTPASSLSRFPSTAIPEYVKRIPNRKTGYQYLSRLRDFENYCSQTYHFKIDELTISKIFKVDVYELLSGYVFYLINRKENKNKISNQTISQRIMTARNFLEYYDIEISPRKFKLKVRIPKVIRRSKEPLTKEYIVKLLESCSSLKLKTYLMFLAATGSRASEACSIRLMDINFDKGEVFIRGEFTKTKQDRHVLLTGELTIQLKLLLDYKYRTRRRYSPTERKYIDFTPEKKDTDLIFATHLDNDTDNTHDKDIDHLYLTLLSLFEQTRDQLKMGYEDMTKRRRKISFHSFRRFVKSTISDLGYSDYSEWFIGHKGSTYYRKSDKEKYQLFKDKIEPYLTFLDQAGLEMRSQDLQSRLEVMEQDNQILRQKDSMNADAIASLSDKMQELVNKVHEMEKRKDINL
jgi:integrase